MTEANTITSDEMRDLERRAIERGAVTGLELMERAGAGVVEAIFEEWPELRDAKHRAVILFGPGNNGGDGFVIARLFKEQGRDVDVFFYGDRGKLSVDAARNLERWLAIGAVTELGFPSADDAQLTRFEDAASHVQDLRKDPANDRYNEVPFLVVDALFGIGLTRHLGGLDDLIWHWDYLLNFRDLNNSRVVAVDVPSGLDADTGEVVGAFEKGAHPLGMLPSDLVVTFHAMKPGHLSDTMRRLGGKVVVKDIGL